MANKKTDKTSICENLAPQTFTFHNGHKYTGEYMIDHVNSEIFRHGYGTYDNSQGMKITGNWIKDNISGEVKIEYCNSMIYQGYLTKSLAYTVGEARFFGGSKFAGDFKKNFENKRIDGVNFIDPNGKKWNHSLTEEDEILLEFDWQQDLLKCDLPCDKVKFCK